MNIIFQVVFVSNYLFIAMFDSFLPDILYYKTGFETSNLSQPQGMEGDHFNDLARSLTRPWWGIPI